MGALVEKCLEKGLRMTDARRTIVSALESANDHPDALTLHDRARRVDPSISQATVYRTLRLLEDVGLVEKHDFKDGRARYENVRDDPHDHLIDLETGDVIEFSETALDPLIKSIAARLGYKVMDHRLELYGTRLK